MRLVSFAINVLKAAGQSPQDASRLGFSTPDILAKNVAALNAKERGPVVTAPEPVKMPLTEGVALERLSAAGLSEGDIIRLRAHMSLQAIASASLSPQTMIEELQIKFKDPDNLEALAMIMEIPESEVESQLGMLRP
jgi:hypothetical protein